MTTVPTFTHQRQNHVDSILLRRRRALHNECYTRRAPSGRRKCSFVKVQSIRVDNRHRASVALVTRVN